MSQNDRVVITEDVFGQTFNHKTNKNEPVFRYTMANEQIKVQLITYGATITSIRTYDKYGKLDDIVLGFDNIDGYKSNINAYFGATVGRYANRIRNASFTLDNKTYQLTKNIGAHQLHGGNIGFDKVNWHSYVANDKIVFTYLSSNLEEGYPGDLLTTVTYELKNTTLSVLFEAVCTTSTAINLTNHSYFNLSGHGSGAQGLYSHIIRINADQRTLLDDELIATGALENLSRTKYDLRTAQQIGNAINSIKEKGFDFNYCLNKTDKNNPCTLAARVDEPNTGRYLELYTDQPGVQFYTGNFLAKGVGKNGAKFDKQSAFCLETQNFPNSVNIKTFPSSILRPGEKYKHTAIYVFGTQK